MRKNQAGFCGPLYRLGLCPVGTGGSELPGKSGSAKGPAGKRKVCETCGWIPRGSRLETCLFPRAHSQHTVAGTCRHTDTDTHNAHTPKFTHAQRHVHTHPGRGAREMPAPAGRPSRPAARPGAGRARRLRTRRGGSGRGAEVPAPTTVPRPSRMHIRVTFRTGPPPRCLALPKCPGAA